jgi:hypothetical protein
MRTPQAAEVSDAARVLPLLVDQFLEDAIEFDVD